MEATYPLESYPCVSQPFKIQEYFNEYTKYLAETLYQKTNELSEKDNELEKIACLMEIDLEECKRLDVLCSLSLLDSKAEEENVSPKSAKKGTDPDAALLEKATRTLVTAVELKAEKSHPLRYARKMRNLKKNLVPNFVPEPNPSPIMKIPSNFIVIARVFRPFNSYCGPQSVPHAQDFMLLGNQSLISFRERITCVNDEVVVGDSINNIEDAGAQVPMKRLFTSGMFFFGNTFYCDFRDMMSKDYGDVIDRWAKENPQMKLGPFQHQPMEQSTIADLEIRLGYPYLYMHLGSCEHLITFVDARLMSPNDLQDLIRYPLIEGTDSNIMYCCACDTYATSWIVEDDAMPTKPANLCKQCFDVFYTRNGQHVTPPFCCMIPPSGPQANVEPSV